MAWISPIYDRVLADITNRTSKAFFNIADWERINGNITVIKAMLDAAGYLDIPLNSLTTPTVTTIPTVTSINQLVENIEMLREAACLPSELGLVELFYAYAGGTNVVAPDYENVNDWERNLDLLYDAIPAVIDYGIHCGVATAGQSRLWQNRFR